MIRLINPYDSQHFSFVSYKHEAHNEKSLSDNIVYAIAQDKNSGKIWVGSRSGLSILNSIDNPNTFTNIFPGNAKNDLPFNEVNSIICSNDGLMWLGLLGGGVCTVNTDRFRFNHNPLESVYKEYRTSSVRSVYKDDKGNLWMGIMGFGLIFYDIKKQAFTPYNKHPVLGKMGYTSTVNAIIKMKKSSVICFGTWDNGVWLFDTALQKATAINTFSHPEMQDDCVYSLLEDSKGNLWIGTRSNIYLLDAKGHLSTLKQKMSKGAPMLPQTTVFSLVEDKDGCVWAATGNNGILRINNDSEQKRVKNYSMKTGGISTNGVLSLCVDHYNRIWAGTDGDGLNLYNRKTDRFHIVDNQYAHSGTVVSNILEDANHTIWLTTNSEMLHLSLSPDGKSMDTRSYTVSDGLQDYSFNRNSCFRSTDNELFFGGYRGLNSFYPDKVDKTAIKSPVVITDIKIHNISLRDFTTSERNKVLDKTIDFTHQITLSHKDNDFSIDFSSLNYINPRLNKYAYMLDGYNSKWIYVNAERRFAHYNNLKSGTYLFRVKGSSENGIWNPEERTLSITILPPFWLSWQAYCFYLLLMLFVAFYTGKIIRNRVRLLRTIEAGKMERQKMEEVNHAKLHFFTNITHELLTPLTIIAASVDELKQLHPKDAGVYQVIGKALF